MESALRHTRCDRVIRIRDGWIDYAQQAIDGGGGKRGQRGVEPNLSHIFRVHLGATQW